MQLPLLALQDISLTFGVVPLLSGAALTVTAGDRICLARSMHEPREYGSFAGLAGSARF
jgi:hypothetical protein